MSFFGGNDRINVIAEITAAEDKVEVVRAIVSSLVTPSRKESGCKQYHLHEDKKQPGVFFTYEEWTSEEALTEHLAGAKPILDQLTPLLAGEMKLTVLTLIS